MNSKGLMTEGTRKQERMTRRGRGMLASLLTNDSTRINIDAEINGSRINESPSVCLHTSSWGKMFASLTIPYRRRPPPSIQDLLDQISFTSQICLCRLSRSIHYAEIVVTGQVLNQDWTVRRQWLQAKTEC